ncbi:MAG: hypothetical protein ABSC62_02300 [Terracidiphilus sp.]|jgi:hypothetical protein
MTDAQAETIKEAMSPFAGIKVNVSISLSEPDSADFGHQLVAALNGAGMDVKESDAYMLVIAGQPATGISFYFSEDRRDVAERLAGTMRQLGIANAPIPAQITSGGPAQLGIVIQPNR